MGFLDKAKELAAKADEAVAQFNGPNAQRDATPLFRDLGAKLYEREVGRSTPSTDDEIAQLIERLQSLEAQHNTQLVTVAETLRVAQPVVQPAAPVGAPPPPHGATPPTSAAAPPPPPAPPVPSAPAAPPAPPAPPTPPGAAVAPPPPPPPAPPAP